MFLPYRLSLIIVFLFSVCPLNGFFLLCMFLLNIIPCLLCLVTYSYLGNCFHACMCVFFLFLE